MVKDIDCDLKSTEGEPGKMPARKRYVTVAELLRHRIISGQLKAGSSLPTRVELADEIGVAMATLQKAINLLTRDGFLVSRGRLGTFVTQSPPHQRRYGILTAPYRDERSQDMFWSLHHEAVWKEAIALAKKRKLAFVLYDGLAYREGSPAYRQLAEDLAAHRLAGMIPVLFSTQLMEMPVFTRTPALPPTVSGRGTFMPLRNHPAWCLNARPTNYAGFVEKAVKYLLSRGRSRIAVIGIGSDSYSEGIRQVFAKHNLDYHHWFSHFLTVQSLHAANHVAQLLMMASPRPDGILITDDNIVEDVTAGLSQSPRYERHELDVVAWCNFPHTPKYHVPVQFIGQDIQRWLLECLDLIEAEKARRQSQ